MESETKPPTPADQAQIYQAVAAAVDEAVTAVLHSAETVAPNAGAIVSGATYALARYVLQTMGEVPTARNAIAVMIKACGRAAEALAVKGVGTREVPPPPPAPPG